MLVKNFVRLFHTKNSYLFATSKSDLAKLRKKTGYTFSNCKKALELNNNDIGQAETWLKEQAQALGWSKLSKLEGRAAAQGLIGISVKDNCAVMIEVNCETDFVARNKNFLSLVQIASQTCGKHLSSLSLNKPLSKVNFEGSYLSSLKATDGKPLSDHNALAVSNLGENLVLRRAVGLKTNGKFSLTGYTHPTTIPNADGTLTGKYGVLIAYSAPSDDIQIQQVARQLCQHIKYAIKIKLDGTLTGKYGVLIAYSAPSDDIQIQQVARQLCQHFVGMNPSKIGVMGEDEPCKNKDDETVMIHQEFLLDPNITVSQIISDVGIELIEFIRYECGQQMVGKDEDNMKQSVAN